MKVAPTPLPEVLVVEPRVLSDERGFFFESFNAHKFHEATGLEPTFVQDNHSRSSQHILRGLHYQLHHPQAKLVRVVAGAIFDVAVDIRRGSPTFGQWVGAELTAENKRQLWIPETFAHGFLVLSGFAEVLYKATDSYDPDSERTILWDDPDIGIDWPLDDGTVPVVSAKDSGGRSLATAEVFD